MHRLNRWLSGKATWQEEACEHTVEEQECPEYNRDLLDPIQPVVKIIIPIIIVVNLILDLACIKYRKLAQLFLYIESVTYLIMSLTPASQFLFMHARSAMYLIIFIALYCDSAVQIIVITVCFIVQNIIVQAVVYLKTIGIASEVLTALLCWLGITAIAMVITYIKEMHNTLHSANEDNLRLLDGMHEGLLILNKSEKNPSALFYNFAVKKIIDNFLAKENAVATT